MELLSSTPLSKFESIYSIINTIPTGSVASYSSVAKAAGLPRGARVVGWALAALPHPSEVPWQRVINKEGKLTIVNRLVSPEDQKLLLSAEGLTIRENAEGYHVFQPRWHIFT